MDGQEGLSMSSVIVGRSGVHACEVMAFIVMPLSTSDTFVYVVVC